MKFNSLHDLYVTQLKDMYSAEKQLTEAIPKMVDAASSSELQEAFQTHLNETEQQLERIRQILDVMQVNPGNVKCDATEGLVEEAEDIISTSGKAAVKDAALIAAAQKVEHYEIATYGCLVTYAEALGATEAHKHLQQSLNEEGEANKKLNSLAKTINKQAL